MGLYRPALARNRPGLRVRNTWDFREFRLPWSRSAVHSRASRARIDLDRRVCRSRSWVDWRLVEIVMNFATDVRTTAIELARAVERRIRKAIASQRAWLVVATAVTLVAAPSVWLSVPVG